MEELTRTEIIEKYNLQTVYKNPKIDDFIRYCKLRGIIIEKTSKRKLPGGTIYKIIKDNRILPNEQWLFNKKEHLWVSSLGRIKTEEGRFLSTDAKVEGYIVTKSNVTQHYLRVHRLVMQTFKPIENEQYFDVDHINGIRSDNRLKNLRWVNTKENIAAKDENQTKIGDLVAQLVQKYGYNETFNKIQALL